MTLLRCYVTKGSMPRSVTRMLRNSDAVAADITEVWPSKS